MTMERWRSRRGLIPWRPFGGMLEPQRIFEDLWPTRQSLRWFPFEEMEWVPAIDMYEKDNNYLIKAELPGMKEEDVDVSVVGDRLVIKGEKKAETEVNEEDYYRNERSYGSFFRSMDIPPDADSDKIEASFENGVLVVTIPKTKEAKPKKIAVSAQKRMKSKE